MTRSEINGDPVMTEVALRLKDELLRLPPEERIEVARAVWESLDDATLDELAEADLLAELERRSAEADAGRSIGEPFRKAIEELRGEPL
jgi:putative addiction module component (TIGR02574 family)